MKFGVFDHMDRGTVPLGEQYENRLKLTEAYDRAGIRTYHLAEHHATPLGMAPSPSVFLCSGGAAHAPAALRPARLHAADVPPAAGRGRNLHARPDERRAARYRRRTRISHLELGHYGVDPATSSAQYVEALAIVLKALSSKTLTFEGKFYSYRDVPIELEPLQKPHPPLWYGVGAPDGVVWAAKNAINVVCNAPARQTRAVTDRYRAEWQAAGKPAATIPLMGMNRHIVIAETEAEALATARRAYKLWYDSFMHLWLQHGTKPTRSYGTTFDELEQEGNGIAGTPEKVRAMLTAQVKEAGNNYLVCRLAFGDLTLAESMRSLDLFARAVMPALADVREAAE